MPKSKFTLADSDRMIRDIIDEFFQQHNIAYDQQELMKTTLLGNQGNVPTTGGPMPDTGMPQ